MRYIIILSIVLLSACSAKLKVYDANGSEVSGVPFRVSELFQKKGMRIAHTKGGDCMPVPFIEILSLSTGAKYFINVDTAELAESEFIVKLNDNGGLTEASLNSKPAAAEQIGAVNDLLQTLVSAASPVPGVSQLAQPVEGALKACDAGESDVVITRLVTS